MHIFQPAHIFDTCRHISRPSGSYCGVCVCRVCGTGAVLVSQCTSLQSLSWERGGGRARPRHADALGVALAAGLRRADPPLVSRPRSIARCHTFVCDSDSREKWAYSRKNWTNQAPASIYTQQIDSPFLTDCVWCCSAR